MAGRTPESERFISDFAVAFVHMSAARVPSEIDQWMTPLISHMGVDCAMIAQYLNNERFTATHVAGWPIAVRRSTTDQLFPWMCAAVSKRQPVIFGELDELPAEALLDRHNFERLGVSAQISVPLIADGALLGLFSISSRETQRKWPSEVITRTHLVASVLANALARRQSWRLQQRMQTQLSELARVGMAGEIAGSLAHELTQPLAAILANAQAGLRFLARDPHSTAEIDEILRDIVRDDKRAGAVISGLRAMMRRRPGERQPVDLSQLVEETLAMLNMNIQTQNVNVQENLETDCTVIADRAQLQQVLVNLIVNAVEAMQSAGVHGRRLLLEVRNGAMVQCAVHDTGKDLRPHRLGQIFEPFWTTKVEGLGMGLAVCRSIINAHDGAIWAEIAQDGGAVFRFELPKGAFHALAPA